jgi:uncharacterized protein YndB with AHSA1/START domain
MGCMASVRVAIDISAHPARVWQAVVDVEAWPRWTRSITEVKRLDTGPLHAGSRARVKQPGLPVLVWEVTELDEGSAFTWVTRIPGVATTARHDIGKTADGARLTLTLEWSGPLAGVAGALNAKRARQSLTQEADGHKAASEASAS